MKRLTPLVVIALALLALGLRLVGLEVGLERDAPELAVLRNRIDELVMAGEVLDGALGGRLDPGGFLHWGSGGYWLYGAIDAAVSAISDGLGLSPEGGLIERWRARPQELLLLHRWVVVAAGVALVLITRRLATRVVSPRAGWIAGLLMACAYLPVRVGHFGTLDVLLALAMAAAAERSHAALRAWRGGRGGGFQALAAGALVGLAGALKYPGLIAGAGLLICALAAGSQRRRALGLTCGAGLVSVLVWLALSPHVFTAPGALLDMLAAQRELLGFDSAAFAGVLRFHLQRTYGEGMGWPAVVAALGGGLVLMRRDAVGRAVVPLLLVGLLPLLATRLEAVRYGMPTTVGLCVFAAAGVDAAARALGRGGSSAGRVGAVVLTVTLLAPNLLRSTTFDGVCIERDTRSELSAWLDQEGIACGAVAAVGTWGLPEAADLAHQPTLRDLGREARRDPKALLGGLHADPPPYLLHERSDRKQAPVIWEALQSLVDARYERVKTFDPRRHGRGPEHVEPTGSPRFMVPWASPWRAARPGPLLDLYARRDP